MRYVYGLDVSGWDQVVDWPKLKRLGLTFTFIKSSEGLWQDSAFAKNWPLAKDAGFLRAPYHFYAQLPDPLAQAQSMVNITRADPGELPPIIDVEHEKTSSGVVIPVANPGQYLNHLHTLLDAVETAFNRTPLIYTSLGFWNEITAKSGGAPAWAARFPLWVAHYPNALYSVPNLLLPPAGFQALAADIAGGVKYRGFPALPAGFKTYKFWQFSAEKYFLEGLATFDDDQQVVPMKSDLDVFPGSESDLRAWAGLAPASDPPVSIPAPTGAGFSPNGAAPCIDRAGKTLPAITNQAMINAFARAFGPDRYWDVVKAAGLEKMAVPPANRPLMYSGPALEDLPLTAAQQAALKQALAL